MDSRFKEKVYTIPEEPIFSPEDKTEIKKDIELRGYSVRGIMRAKDGQVSRVAMAVMLSKDDTLEPESKLDLLQNYQSYVVDPSTIVNEGPVSKDEIMSDRWKVLDTIDAFVASNDLEDQIPVIAHNLITSRGYVRGKLFVFVQYDPAQEEKEEEPNVVKQELPKEDEDYQTGISLAEEMFVNRPDLLPPQQDLRALPPHQRKQFTLRCHVISFNGRRISEKIGELTLKKG